MDTKAICGPDGEASAVLVKRDGEELAPHRGMVVGGLIEGLVQEIGIAIVLAAVFVVGRS